MGRKILCPSCGSVINEDVLIQKNSQDTCLVCGASLDSDDTEKPVKSESDITWYYYEWKKDGTYFIIEKEEAEKQNLAVEDEDIILKHTFQAPPEDENGDCDAAKEVLRREYKPDAFKEPDPDNVIKPDALWIKEGKCPKCHSSNIQLVPRKWSIWTGYRTNSVSRICVNCKHRF